MTSYLGLPLEAVLSSLPEGAAAPGILETAAPRRDGQTRQGGTLRIVVVREGVWIVARFIESVKRAD